MSLLRFSHKDDYGRDDYNRHDYCHVVHDNSHVNDGHSMYSRDGDEDSMKGRSSRIWHCPSLQPQSIPII